MPIIPLHPLPPPLSAPLPTAFNFHPNPLSAALHPVLHHPPTSAILHHPPPAFHHFSPLFTTLSLSTSFHHLLPLSPPLTLILHGWHPSAPPFSTSPHPSSILNNTCQSLQYLQTWAGVSDSACLLKCHGSPPSISIFPLPTTTTCNI